LLNGFVRIRAAEAARNRSESSNDRSEGINKVPVETVAGIVRQRTEIGSVAALKISARVSIDPNQRLGASIVPLRVGVATSESSVVIAGGTRLRTGSSVDFTSLGHVQNEWAVWWDLRERLCTVR
jgi:hypothetical protein